MALRVDAGHGVKETGSAQGLAIPVGHLGRHDASFHYSRSAVKVRWGDSTFEVWLNVDPAAIGGPESPGPGMWQDEEGRWHARGDADLEELCAAANSTGICPEPVQIVRR